jgi:hypothetical protein
VYWRSSQYPELKDLSAVERKRIIAAVMREPGKASPRKFFGVLGVLIAVLLLGGRFPPPLPDLRLALVDSSSCGWRHGVDLSSLVDKWPASPRSHKVSSRPDKGIIVSARNDIDSLGWCACRTLWRSAAARKRRVEG